MFGRKNTGRAKLAGKMKEKRAGKKLSERKYATEKPSELDKLKGRRADGAKPRAKILAPATAPKKAGGTETLHKTSGANKGPKPPGSFGDAFKAARKGKGSGKTFTFNGKSYSTNTKAEGIGVPTAKSAGVPMKPKKKTVAKGSPAGTGTVLREGGKKAVPKAKPTVKVGGKKSLFSKLTRK